MNRIRLERPRWGRLRTTLFLTGVFLVLIPALAVAIHDFPDVPTSHTHHDSISWLNANGITTGFADGTFRPEDNVTRGQMASFMKRNAGVLVAAGATVNVSAIIFPPSPPSLGKWFNNVNDQMPTFTNVATGVYELDFGFDLSDRFVQATASPTGLSLLNQPLVRWATASVSGTKVRVYTYSFNTTTGEPQQSSSNVHILIY